jgi:predicted alpha/beta-fold hydrolase
MAANPPSWGAKPFEPHPLLRSGHLQTLATVYVRRRFSLPPAEPRLFRVDPESQIKGMCHWQPGSNRRAYPVVVTVHGLEGSCDSNYALGIADKAYALGFHAIRLNQRNCGGTESLTPTLYNSGMSSDYRAVLMELIEQDGFENIFFAGYSMGGNLVTKMAGEWAGNAPPQLRAVAAVCPALDLAACADALEKPENYFYERHFVRGLMIRYLCKAELFPDRYSKNGFGPIRTVREFDDAITAPCFGYRDAQEYYEAAGAKRVLADIRVPLLLTTAHDDPFVPYDSLIRAGAQSNSCVQFVAPTHGGHCGFISRWEGKERFWAEQRIVEFFAQRVA